MADWKTALFELGVTAIGFVMMIVLGIVAFFVTVFIIDTGAGLAGKVASGDFVVLAATILVAAAIIGGRSSGMVEPTAVDEDGGDSPEVA